MTKPSEESGQDSGRRFDLEERTAQFGEVVIQFLKQLPSNDITSPLIRQLVRSATSVGANYCEADESGSKKEFRHRIGVCKRESKESKYWLRMLATVVPDQRDQARQLWKEGDELNRIFAAIFRKLSDT